jgi:diguanylate cyclase (GGDEF)-like protein/PAS domain S-box-containing protein
MVGAVLFVTLHHSLASAEVQLGAADREKALLLQDLGRIALLTDEFGNVQAFIEKLDRQSRIRFVAVLDLTGRIRASSDPAQIGTRPVEPSRLAAPADEVQAITNGSYTLGWLRVRFSNESLIRAHRAAYRLGIVTACIGMLSIAVVGWTMGHLLTRKLTRLAAFADQVSAGDLTSRAHLVGRDEAARVGRAFDAMVDRLGERLETIRIDRDRLILPTEAINEGFALWDDEERLVLCNQRFRNLLGDVQVGTRYEDFLAGPVARAIAENGDAWPTRMAGMLDRHRRGSGTTEVSLRDGRWLRVSKSRLQDGQVIGIYTDITEAKSRELALLDSEQQLRAIMESVGEGIMVLDACGRVQVMNPTADCIFGRAAGTSAGTHVDELLLGSGEYPAGPAPGARAELIGIRADGARFPVEVSMGVLRRAGGVRIATVRDVTLQKADRERILLQATHDELTGMPNRRLFDDRLDVTLRRAARTGELVAVAFLDVDRFKTVNDSLGHAMGDRLLVELSRRLRSCLRDSDTVARMGGDEFIFILPGLHGREDAARPVRKLLEAIRVPVRIEEQELFVTSSVGVSVYPVDGQQRDRLLRHADAALYRAKARGRNRYELYEPAMSADAAARVSLDADLRRACGQDELRMVYQPQINLRTGRVVGFEALMRWRHPRLGLVPPGTFIPIAEETGLINSLGEWALRESCRAMVAWARHSQGPLRIAVNVSPRQLQHDDLVAQVEQILRETGLAAGQLELELTETTLLLEDEPVEQTVAGLRRLGVGLALDDFGTGYSSLSHLRRYPIQRLKMDRSFVRGIVGDRGDAAVARAVIGLARELDLAVVAEGVETAEQLALLRSLGCDEAQGFLLGRPAAASEVADALLQAA